MSQGGVMRREVWASKFVHVLVFLAWVADISWRIVTRREEAHRLFSQSPFFAAWDPEVLDIYVECGLYAPSDVHASPSNSEGAAEDSKELVPLKDAPIKDKKHEVRLKMPGYQEAVVFGERRVGHEVFEMLPGLEERIPIRWIVAGTNANT